MIYIDHLISLGIGIAGYFLSLLIHRLWSQISTTEIQRRLKEYETERAKLDNLSRSDRALMIHGFQGVFALFALLFVVLGIQTILATKRLGDPFDGWEILQLATWLIASLLSIAGAKYFQKIADHPKSLEKIDERIANSRTSYREDDEVAQPFRP